MPANLRQATANCNKPNWPSQTAPQDFESSWHPFSRASKGKGLNMRRPKYHADGSKRAGLPIEEDFEEPEVDPRVGAALISLFPDSRLVPCGISEWIHLNEGQRVVARRLGEYPRAGEIDAVSEDAFVFWVWLDNGEGRIMVHAQDDVRVWTFP